jgi:menaquinone-specific isochorismate synthase
MSEFAFIETSPGRLLVGQGPFDSAPWPDRSRPAFYVNDFFLEDPEPWKHPAEARDVTAAEFAAEFTACEAPAIDWEQVLPSTLESLFRSAHSEISAGTFQKIVPILFEKGGLGASPDRLVSHIVRRLQELPPALHPYGCVRGSAGFVGATPEILFRTDRRRYETMALAGTRPLERADELLEDPKEQEEHRIVIDDIRAQLQDRGTVSAGPTAVVRFPSLAHLHTPITFEPDDPDRFDFGDMVNTLHPTAALGGSPRSASTRNWLRNADRNVHRGVFGAPFGLRRPDGSGICLVAIRNVTWNGRSVRIGSGAGVVRESKLEAEFEELRRKREQVKLLLGLAR